MFCKETACPKPLQSCPKPLQYVWHLEDCVFIIMPGSPFATVLQKSFTVPTSVCPWVPPTSSVWCKEEQGQLSVQIQGRQTQLPSTCFVMGHPRKCFAESVYKKSRVVLPLGTQFVFQPEARAFGGWGSCHGKAFVEGYYEQVHIQWRICSPSRSDWCNISCCDRWRGFSPSQYSLFSSLHKAGCLWSKFP